MPARDPGGGRRTFESLSLRVALAFLAFGVCWIYVSDAVLAFLVRDPELLRWLQTGKGWVYVVASTVVLYYLVHRGVRSLQVSRETLRESQRTLHTLLGNLPGMAYRCRCDRDWTMEFVSQGCRELTGYFPQDLVGNRKVAFGDLIRPEDRQPVWDAIHKALGEGRSFQLTYRLLPAQGPEKCVWEQGVGVFSATGELLALEGFITEITEMKRVQEQLTRLATVVEQASEAIVLTDREGRIQYVNPAFERVCGHPRDDALGRGLDLLECATDDAVTQLQANLRQGHPWRGRLSCQRPDGCSYEVESVLSPVRDEGGVVQNYALVSRDITEQIKLERQVRQAQKLEALGTLAGGIAHDFNNILTPIIGYAQLVADRLSEGSEVQHDLQRVVSAGMRAKELVTQILTFSRRGEQERHPVHMAPIVKETVQLLRAFLPSTIEIHSQIETAGDKVVADPTQIHQVLMNLCTNAGHAMGDKPGVLDIRLAPVAPGEHDVGDGSGAFVRLTVRDTGCGMSRQVQERIFEPFFTTKPGGEGTGMGLAVVHGIVRSHGGELSVYSEPEQGATFHVWLPRAGDEARATTAEPEPVTGGSERILVVDDEATVVDVTRQILENLGYRVRGESSGAAALAAFGAEPGGFDLVLTDLTMPKLTGLDLSREILRIRPGTPVILVTGFCDGVPAQVAADAGVREVLGKPLTGAVLGRAVRRVLDAAAAEA